jgi:pimeloyl-ACP methyl ester carboxylesterase
MFSNLPRARTVLRPRTHPRRPAPRAGPKAVTDPIRVRIHGDRGPVIFLLHGGPGAAGSVWDLAEELSDEFQVHEAIQRRSGARRLTVFRHVSDLRELVVAPAVMVGHSWGAMLGLSFAARYPASLRGLVLIGCGTYDSRSREIYRARMQKNLGSAGRQRVEALSEEIGACSSDPRRDRLFAKLGQMDSRAQAFDELRLRAGYRAILDFDSRGFEETWDDAVRLQRVGREPAAFRAISCPVLMLHGDDDPHPGGRIATTLRRYIPQLEYHSFPRCGHVPWRERHARERFLLDLRTWIHGLWR